MINGYVGPALGIEDIYGIFKGLYEDNNNQFTINMNLNEKIAMVFRRDYHRRKLYLNLRKQELMAPVGDTVCRIVHKVYGYFVPTLGIKNRWNLQRSVLTI